MAEALPDRSNSDFSDEDSQSATDKSFNAASAHVRKITSKLNNDQLLELYGLYKQSTEGKCNMPKPGWFDGKGRKKWEAWNALNNMPSEEAKQKYVDLVQQLDPVPKLEGNPKESWAAVSTLQHSPEPELVHNQLTIIDAAKEDLVEVIEKLLSQDPELVHIGDEDGLTATHWAADRNATNALKVLIKADCFIDARDYSGQTPLHYAASCDHVEATRILLDAGALLLADDEDVTALDVATNEEVRRMLESAEINR